MHFVMISSQVQKSSNSLGKSNSISKKDKQQHQQQMKGSSKKKLLHYSVEIRVYEKEREREFIKKIEIFEINHIVLFILFAGRIPTKLSGTYTKGS